MRGEIICSTCEVPTPNSYRLCDDCRRASVVAERAAQGLPPTVTDPTAIGITAFNIRQTRTEAAA